MKEEKDRKGTWKEDTPEKKSRDQFIILNGKVVAEQAKMNSKLQITFIETHFREQLFHIILGNHTRKSRNDRLDSAFEWNVNFKDSFVEEVDDERTHLEGGWWVWKGKSEESKEK